MMEVEELLQQRERLQKAVASAEQATAVAQANRDRLKAELQQKLTVLKEDFGCNSLAEATTKLTEMQAKAEALYAEIEEGLRALGN